MLLFRHTTRWVDPQATSLGSIPVFARGEWMQLLLASRECCEKALSASIRRRRTQQDTPERRAERAQTMVLMGEVSAERRALEDAPLATGTEATLKKLRQRPPAPRTPIAAEILAPTGQPLEELENVTPRGCSRTVRDDRRTRETTP